MSDLAPRLIGWFASNARDLPWRRPGFSAWGVLVSEVMLQQTPATRVIPHLEAWLDRWPTPETLAEASPADVLKQWSNLGYPRRALWLREAAIEIRDRFGGEVPHDVEQLLQLSGIGDYTARAVAVFAYHQRHPVVDTNTRRVLARAVHGRSQPGAPSRRDLLDMDAQLPDDPEQAFGVNAATMELGATVCLAGNPLCDRCPIHTECRWYLLGRPDTGDVRPRQARYKGSDREARGAILQTLRQHPEGGLAQPQVLADWPDRAQRRRAIASLIADGLVVADHDQVRLPD
ncbi:MAG TPA: A/G-specific adenine glycosylase [Propionicimonas sp.]|nr:A/G-specific adenine glycosylase [Propionicimonas sp.]